MENNSINNNIIQRAKKISQFDRLDINDFLDVENLWLILGYRNDDEQLVENYKINIFDLAELLIQSGLMTGESGNHKIIYNLTNITTQSSNKFKGSVFTIFLTPAKGYKLPENVEDIEVRNCNIETYNPISGSLKISTNSSDNISIYISGVGEEYGLTINTNDNLTYQIVEGEKPVYNINDVVSISISSYDPINYGIPEINDITYSNITVISYIEVGNTKKLTFRFNGTGDAVINLNSYIIINYYFGHSVIGDDVLTYDENGVPTGVGSNFSTLYKVHNGCPINFNSTYEWPSDIPEDTLVYVIVPKDYFIPEANMYNDNLYKGYTRIVTQTGMTRNVQNDEITNELMCYSFEFNTIEYWAYCISREGISGEDSFRDNGYISDKPLRIFWHTEIPDIMSNQSLKVNIGTVEALYGNRQTREINPDELVITLDEGEGTFNEATNTYTYNGAPIGDKPKEIVFKITWTTKNLSDYKYVNVYTSKVINSIIYLSTEDSVESGKSMSLSKSNVRLVYDDSSTGNINNSCVITFECNKGTIRNINENYTYFAPNVIDEDTDTISVICTYNSNTYTFGFDVRITPKIDIDGAYWYIGIDMPTEPYNPERNLATDNGLGWRKINGDITSYTSKINPIYNGVTKDAIVTENDSFYFYFGIPVGCEVSDDFGSMTDFYQIVKTVSMGGITYNFYKGSGSVFNVYITYKG